MNWNRIKKRDADLRTSADNASEALAKLRWENTLGASPKVAYAEYARQCGVAPATVMRYAKAWEIVSSAHDRVDEYGQPNPLTISEAIVQAGTSVDRAAVIETIAKARGVTPKAVQAHHKPEVRRVERFARERAERKGTTVAEEAKNVVADQVRHKKVDRATQVRKAKATDWRWMEIEDRLLKARRALLDALAIEVEGLTDEHRGLLTDAIGKVRSVLDLVEMKFIDVAPDVDWDKELTRLAKEN